MVKVTDEEITLVRKDPLCLLLKLPDGYTPGRWEAVEPFADVIAEARRRYPGTSFQMLPFAYDGDGGLMAVLAVSDERVLGNEEVLNMRLRDFFTASRLREHEQSKGTGVRAHITIVNWLPRDRQEMTVREFLEKCSVHDLKMVPSTGAMTIATIKATLAAYDLTLRE